MSMDRTADSKASILTAALRSRFADRNVTAYLMTATGQAPQVLAGLAGRRQAPGTARRCRAVVSGGRSQSWRMLP
jgi:hypothetical protein